MWTILDLQIVKNKQINKHGSSCFWVNEENFDLSHIYLALTLVWSETTYVSVFVQIILFAKSSNKVK